MSKGTGEEDYSNEKPSKGVMELFKHVEKWSQNKHERIRIMKFKDGSSKIAASDTENTKISSEHFMKVIIREATMG